jgi:hypothetical protein
VKKYELTEESIRLFDRTLYRIKALIDIPSINVKKGDLGGFVESERNLSQEGNCWMADEAIVFGEAKVFGAARVYEQASVYGEARVFGEAEVFGEARVFGEALVTKTSDYLTISPIGSENGVLTAFKDKEGKIFINRGCYTGTIEEFEQRVKEVHGENKYGLVYLSHLTTIKLQLHTEA